MLASVYLRSIIRAYNMYKDLGERALGQVSSDDELNHQIDAESNSIAIIVKHVSGNLHSRFRDFLTTDGEKPDRNRDGEFEADHPTSRNELLDSWNAGFKVALESIESLKPEDLDRTVAIRGEELLVVEALNRSVTHIAYHTGQLVYLARHFASAGWQPLSIPKGRSADFGKGSFRREPRK